MGDLTLEEAAALAASYALSLVWSVRNAATEDVWGEWSAFLRDNLGERLASAVRSGAAGEPQGDGGKYTTSQVYDWLLALRGEFTASAGAGKSPPARIYDPGGGEPAQPDQTTVQEQQITEPVPEPSPVEPAQPVYVPEPVPEPSPVYVPEPTKVATDTERDAPVTTAPTPALDELVMRRTPVLAEPWVAPIAGIILKIAKSQVVHVHFESVEDAARAIGVYIERYLEPIREAAIARGEVDPATLRKVEEPHGAIPEPPPPTEIRVTDNMLAEAETMVNELHEPWVSSVTVSMAAAAAKNAISSRRPQDRDEAIEMLADEMRKAIVNMRRAGIQHGDIDPSTLRRISGAMRLEAADDSGAQDDAGADTIDLGEVDPDVLSETRQALAGVASAIAHVVQNLRTAPELPSFQAMYQMTQEQADTLSKASDEDITAVTRHLVDEVIAPQLAVVVGKATSDEATRASLVESYATEIRKSLVTQVEVLHAVGDGYTADNPPPPGKCGWVVPSYKDLLTANNSPPDQINGEPIDAGVVDTDALAQNAFQLAGTTATVQDPYAPDQAAESPADATAADAADAAADGETTADASAADADTPPKSMDVFGQTYLYVDETGTFELDGKKYTMGSLFRPQGDGLDLHYWQASFLGSDPRYISETMARAMVGALQAYDAFAPYAENGVPDMISLANQDEASAKNVLAAATRALAAMKAKNPELYDFPDEWTSYPDAEKLVTDRDPTVNLIVAIAAQGGLSSLSGREAGQAAFADYMHQVSPSSDAHIEHMPFSPQKLWEKYEPQFARLLGLSPNAVVQRKAGAGAAGDTIEDAEWERGSFSAGKAGALSERYRAAGSGYLTSYEQERLWNRWVKPIEDKADNAEEYSYGGATRITWPTEMDFKHALDGLRKDVNEAFEKHKRQVRQKFDDLLDRLFAASYIPESRREREKSELSAIFDAWEAGGGTNPFTEAQQRKKAIDKEYRNSGTVKASRRMLSSTELRKIAISEVNKRATTILSYFEPGSELYKRCELALGELAMNAAWMITEAGEPLASVERARDIVGRWADVEVNRIAEALLSDREPPDFSEVYPMLFSQRRMDTLEPRYRPAVFA